MDKFELLAKRVDELERITSHGPVTLTQAEYARLKDCAETADAQDTDSRVQAQREIADGYFLRCVHAERRRDELEAYARKVDEKYSRIEELEAHIESLTKQSHADSADVRLGRMVRNMPADGKVWSFLIKIICDGVMQWQLRVGDSWIESHDTVGKGATPEQALQSAGVKP